ncbi:amino acid adenylation domain-containing protein [Streptomyces diastaticus]|uniref:amino acid adenylation domain-containing protein n=1 Tax=Streptomyces diastaticus TaxID=1956 RepID=UPI0033DA44F5
MTTTLGRNQAVHDHPEQADFWRSWIAEHPSPTAVPRDLLGQGPQRPPAAHETVIDAGTALRIRTITRQDPVLLRVLLTAALAVIAARATDRDEVDIVSAGMPGGAPAFPLSVATDRAASFRALLAATRGAYLAGASCLDVPVDHLFTQENAELGDFSLAVGEPPATAAPATAAPATADLFVRPLHFHVTPDGETLRLRLSYRADLFTADTARGLAETFARILDRVTATPEDAIGPLLDADDPEWERVFAGPGTEFPDDTTLHAFLEEQAVRTPHRVAIADDGTTYEELNRKANRLAHRLRDLGVRPGDVVGVCMSRSPLALVAIYAVLKAGAAYLPVDPTLPSPRIDYLTRHSGVRTALGTAATRAAIAGVDTFLDLEDEASFDGAEDNPEGGAGPDDLCYVIYTSGSTGRPKGVMVEHRAIVNRLWWMQRAYPLDASGIVLHKTPLTFDVSVWEVFWWSIAGAAVCILPSGDERDPERVAARIADHGVTVTHFVPSMLRAFLHYSEASGGPAPLASLSTVFASGEALPTATAASFTAFLPAVRLVNLYGPTEAAVDVSHFDCAGLDTDRPLPIGQPIDNIRLYVLTRGGTPAPVGTPGELHIAGVGLARGYLGADEMTEERFVPDTVSGSGRMYRTGDLVRRLPGGDIEYLGRLDQQVKIRGYRIEPGEIEHVLARCAGVADCAVHPVADDAGDLVLCVYVVPADGFDEAVLRTALAAELPSYMVPQHVVPLDEIPTNHNGKRDVSRLPRPVRQGSEHGHVAPRDAAERSLAAAWERALGVARVGAHDDFFMLGGDSIKGVVVLAALREAGFELSFQDLFAHPTLAAAAAFARPVEPASHASGPGANGVRPFGLLAEQDRERLPGTAVDAYPLSALQAGLLYEVARTGDTGLYHDIARYRVNGPVEVETFRAALATVVERHPVFRTSFHATGFTTPLQIVHAEVPVPLDVLDLSTLSEREQAEALDRWQAEELARGFAPGEPDLVQVRLCLLGERGYEYVLSYHAAALDGWSVSTIHRDLFRSYFRLVRGELPETSPALGSGYPDFLALERESVESTSQRAFWTGLLEAAQSTRIPRLEAVEPKAADSAERGGVIMRDVTLPEGMTARVLRTAAELRVPVKTVLLTAHVAVMGFVAGTDDVLVGYEHSGRPEVRDGERLAGLFLNTVPFRLRLGDVSWAELVRHVYAAEAELLPHRRYPMGEMKRQTTTRGALFESVFNFTHFHVLKDLVDDHGFTLVRSRISSRTEFPFRAEFWQDAFGDEVGLALHCHEGEFTSEQITRLEGYYVRALHALTEHTDERHAARTLLGDAELALLDGWSTGPRHELPDGTLLDVFAAQVARAPGATALVHGAERLDYRGLDEESDRVACFLRKAGVGRGDVVAVTMDRGLPWAVGVLAVLKAGAVYLPQEPADPPERLTAMLRRSDCRHVLLDGPYVEKLGDVLKVGTGTAGGPALTVLDYAEAQQALAEADPVSQPGPEDAAYIIFTSGSTGEPKGALIHHRGMLNHLLAKCVDLDLTGTDRVAQVATQCFDISVWQLVVPWLVGGQTVIYDHARTADLPGFLRALREDGISILELVPSYLDALLAETGRAPLELPALRYTLVTGETLPPALTRRWFARYDVPLVNAYGPTEASDDVTHHVITGTVDGDRVPVGRPIVNTRIRVVAPDGRIVPEGTYGEVVVTGTGVGCGYVNDAERTAAAFPVNTYDDSSPTLYRTGDVGRWLPSGVLDCAGRLDHQVKVRGHRIELTEIEGTLARVIGVDHAVVLVRTVAGEKLLVAHFTGAAEPDLALFREAAGASLPSYMLPDLLIKLESFPLTSNGKVDRAALGRIEVDHGRRGRLEPAADALEAEVLQAYRDVLGFGPGEFGVTDNFFDYGGHSLAAMRVTSRLAGRASLRDVVDRPTARGLADSIRATLSGRRRPLLVDLTRAAGLAVEPTAPTVVCLPFAGGGAISYVPLARALHDGGRPVRVLGVDLPGRDRDDTRLPVPAAQLAEELAAEIARETAGELVLLGHSAGAGPVLTTAAALRRIGRAPAQLVAVAKVLWTLREEEYRAKADLVLTDADVWSWLADNTGLQEADELSPDDRGDIARAFRYDMITSNHSFALAVREAWEAPSDCPVTVLLAEDDPLTRATAQEVQHWAHFGSALRVVQAEHGSHYLNATRPEFLAAEIRASLNGSGK